MKLRKTPPTEGLVGIAMHVLFVFFNFGARPAHEWTLAGGRKRHETN